MPGRALAEGSGLACGHYHGPGPPVPLSRSTPPACIPGGEWGAGWRLSSFLSPGIALTCADAGRLIDPPRLFLTDLSFPRRRLDGLLLVTPARPAATRYGRKRPRWC